MARQQEAQQRLQAQSILNPAAPIQNKPQVKDLTATLVENNLNQIKYTRPTGDQGGGTPGWQSTPATFKPAASPQGFGAFQSAPMNQQWQWQASPAAFPVPQQPMMGTMLSNSQPVFTPPANSQPVFTPTATSLDTLLPSVPGKLPMNRMPMAIQQPIMGMSPFQQPQVPQQAKALSSSEINDFLS